LRLRALLTTPRQAVAESAGAPRGLRAVLVPDVLMLAAIGPLAHLISTGLIGRYQPETRVLSTVVPGMWVRAPATAALTALAGYGIALAGFFCYAAALERTATAFGGSADRAGAYRTAALSATPVWVAGALGLCGSLPWVGFLAPLGLIAALVYAVLIGSFAVPLHLRTPEPRAIGQVLAALGLTVAATVILYWMVATLLIGALVV